MTDPHLYARSFADVYDDWYHDLDDPMAVVGALRARLSPGSCIVELGSGTGRLANPLSHNGLRVFGVDISVDMLQQAGGGAHGVAADMASIPLTDGVADAVVIAYNTLLNLSARDQQRCLAKSARLLATEGLLVIEAFVAGESSDGSTPFGVSIRTHPTQPDAYLAIVSGPDADDPALIVGSHIEIGSSTTCRPWRLTYHSPTELDAIAAAVGLRLQQRCSDWSGTAFAAEEPRHVSWYERI